MCRFRRRRPLTSAPRRRRRVRPPSRRRRRLIRQRSTRPHPRPPHARTAQPAPTPTPTPTPPPAPAAATPALSRMHAGHHGRVHHHWRRRHGRYHAARVLGPSYYPGLGEFYPPYANPCHFSQVWSGYYAGLWSPTVVLGECACVSCSAKSGRSSNHHYLSAITGSSAFATMTVRPMPSRHCEERSDEAIQPSAPPGLLRSARNDGKIVARFEHPRNPEWASRLIREVSLNPNYSCLDVFLCRTTTQYQLPFAKFVIDLDASSV